MKAVRILLSAGIFGIFISVFITMFGSVSGIL